MAKERFLVTGAGGCIGAWTVASLVAEGTEVVAFDLSGDLYRLRLAGVEDTSGVTFRQGDVRDEAAMKNLVESEAITHIVDLLLKIIFKIIPQKTIICIIYLVNF